jgi:histidinol-phosphate aminotransferase
MCDGMSRQSRSDTGHHGFLLTRRALGRSVALTTLGACLWPDAVTNAMQPAMMPKRARATAHDLESLIRIGANENPYGLGPAAADALRQHIAGANRYPNEVTSQLVSAVAKFNDVPVDWIALSPGSGDILRAATLTFTSPTRALVGAAPTFEAPARIAQMTGAPVRAPKVTATGPLDLPAMAAQAAGAGMIYVCNPNNPTGSIVSAAAVADLVARVRKVNTDAIVLVDEAYADLVDDPSYGSATSLITQGDTRVLLSRTFSKIHGMAGLRVGYAVGHPDTLAILRKNLSSGNLAATSLAAAFASLGDTENLKKQKTLNRDTRAVTRQAFEKGGFTVLPSEANFLMVDIRRDVRGYVTACRDAGVLIARPFPPLDTFARITIGTVEEMQKATPIMLSLLASTPTSAERQGQPQVAQQAFMRAANAALAGVAEIPGYPACC